MNALRFALNVCLAGGLGCAQAPAARRDPADLPSGAADPLAVAAQPYRDAVVEEAFLLGPPDAGGRRAPVCWLNPAGRPELTPSFLRTSERGRNIDFGLPACTPAQTTTVARVAGHGDGSRTAMLPVVAGAGAALGTICAIDFTLTAAMMMAVNAYTNHAEKPRDRAGTGGSGAGLGGTMIAGGTYLWSLGPGGAVLAAPAALTAVVTTCMVAGGAVGYWLVPLKK